MPDDLTIRLVQDPDLGITFQTSKMYIQFRDNVPHFSNGKILELANKEQETEFYKLRGQEKQKFEFCLPAPYVYIEM
jgi:hypothetical protein